MALAKHGLGRRDIGPTVNLFKPVFVEPDGSFTWRGASTRPGADVELRAEMAVLVALTVTPHVLDPRPEYTVSPLGSPPSPASPPARTIRSAPRPPRRNGRS